VLQLLDSVARVEHVRLEFDTERFFGTVESRRKADGVSWRQLGRHLNLSPSTFSRLAKGRKPDVETFLKILYWLNLPAETFMMRTDAPPSRSSEDALSAIATALRRDPNLRREDVEPIEEIVRVAYSRFRRPTDST